MARIAEITLKDMPERHILSRRETIDFMKDYAAFAEKALDEALAYLEQAGKAPAGGPMVCFHNTDLAELDVEMGFPVAELLSGENGIRGRTLPAVRVATTIDQGPYEHQDPTLVALMAWVQEQALQPQGPIWYQYLNDTDRPEAQLLTLMELPLA